MRRCHQPHRGTGPRERHRVARTLNKNLVALGSAAIVGIYALGYARTQSAASPASFAASLPPPAVAMASPPPTSIAPISAATAIARAIATAPPTAPAASASAPAAPAASARAASAYRDGTYDGSGSNRRGTLDVAVTIQNGAITGAQITRYDMYYSASRISRLPGEVVARQNAQVDMVSGATYSAQAFKQAVSQALLQATGQGA